MLLNELTFINESEEIEKFIFNSIIIKYIIKTTAKFICLSDLLIDTKYGYTASASTHGSHRFVRITDIKNDKINWDNVPFCNCENSSEFLLCKNDILIARTGGTTGKSVVIHNIKESAVFASYLIRLRLKNKEHLSFLKIFLNSHQYWEQIISQKTGSAQPNVNANILRNLKVPDILSFDFNTLIDYIENGTISSKSISNLNVEILKFRKVFSKINSIDEFSIKSEKLIPQLRKAILQSAFQGKLLPQDPNDEPASELLKQIKAEKEKLIKEKKLKKEKELPTIKPEEIPFDIPINWKWCRFTNILNLSNTSLRRGPFGSSIKKSMFVPKTDKAIKIYEQKNAIYKNYEIGEYFIDLEEHKNLTSFLVYPGDIIISCAGTIGETYVLPEKAPVGIINQALLKIKLNNSIILNDYFLIVFKSLIKSMINDDAKGSAMKNLGSINYLKSKLFIPLPHLSEQKRIVEKVDKLMKYCDELVTKIKSTKAEADKLMQAVLAEAFGNK